MAFSPKTKILLYISLAIFIFISSSVQFSFVLLITVIVFAFQLPFASLRRGLVPITLLLTFTFISNILFQDGRAIYKIIGLSVTREGLVRGGLLTLNLIILILGAKVLTATTKAEELINGMSGILGPVGRISYVQELISTMSLTLRLLPIIYSEAAELYKDVKNSNEPGLAGKLKLSVELLTNLFQRSLVKAEEMSEAEKPSVSMNEDAGSKN